MTEQLSPAYSVSGAEALAATGREVEPLIKGEIAASRDQDNTRALSEPSSLKIDPPGGGKERQGKGKSAPAKPPKDVADYRVFRRLCDRLWDELRRIDDFLVEEKVSEEGSEVVAEVEALLEELYAFPYGQGESLKRLVVAVQSQVNNAPWDRRHIGFLRDVFRFLRFRYLVDEAAINTCYDFMKERRLDPFRGTICEPQVVKRYRIQEIVEDDKPDGRTPKS